MICTEELLNNITAKSALNIEEIKAKVELGFKNLELQILNDTILFDVNDVKDYVKAVLKLGINIVGIHTALKSNDYSVGIANTSLNLGRERDLRFACTLAEQFAVKQKHDVYVVVHNDSTIERYDNLMAHLATESQYKLNVLENPHIKILIENVTPLLNDSTSGYMHFRNGVYMLDCYDIADKMNRVYCKDHFGVLFDTCHNMILTDMIGLLHKYVGKEVDYLIPNIESEIETSGDLLYAVHLSNKINGGYGKEHSTRFNINDKEDVAYVTRVIKQLSQLDHSVKIVLEISEDDYIKNPNVIATKEVVEYVIKNCI